MPYLNNLQGFNASARGAFCTEAKALIARMSSTPTLKRQYLINRLVVDLKDAGIWTRLDGLYVFAAHTSQAALLNWVASNNASNGGVSFAADVGYTGNDTNTITASPTMAAGLTDHHCGTYCSAYSSQPTGTDRIISIASGTSINNRDGSNTITTNSSNGTADTVSGTATGHVALSRNNSSDYGVYSQGLLLATKTRTGSTLSSPGFTILNGCDGGVTVQAAHGGLSLTGTQMAKFSTALAGYVAGL